MEALEAVRAEIEDVKREAKEAKQRGKDDLYVALQKRLGALQEEKVLLMKEAAVRASGGAGGPAGPSTRTGRPAQIDEGHLAGSPQLFANLQLRNNVKHHDTDFTCTVEALVDTGCSYDLVLPGNKVKHLQLEFVRDSTVEGFGGQFVQMAVFSPLKVTIKLEAPDGSSQEKWGYLKPACIKSEYSDANDLDTVLRNKESWQEFSKRSKDVDQDGTSILELSPVRRPRQAGVVPSTLLGLSGLKELGLVVDAAHSQLLPLIEIGMII